MLWTLIAILLVLWLVGVFLKFTAGGLLHLVLIIAVIVAIVKLFRGKSTT
jgi:hypothetical protein